MALSEIATIDELAALCALSAPSADSGAEPVESNALRGLLAGVGLVPYVGPGAVPLPTVSKYRSLICIFWRMRWA